MDAKAVAVEILAQGTEIKTDIEGLKANVEGLLQKHLQAMKAITGEMPTKEAFLAVVAELIDAALVLPQPMETFDGMVISFLLKNLDKYVLDKYLGETWYEKLLAKVI